MTGAPIRDPGDGIWEEGELVSWDHINGQIYEQEGEKLLERAIKVARDYLNHTGRHLPVYGELGELYIEHRYEMFRNKPCAEGSDGRIGDTFVEVKTIGPEKGSEVVKVKRSGNFGILVVG